MTYVTSDIHGNYDAFLRLLETIHFSDSDTLHILGDLCDRGPASAKLMLDVMDRPNVQVIAGNHEYMAMPVLNALLPRSFNRYSEYFEVLSDHDAWLWLRNGGDTTLGTLFQESREDQLRILEYIKNLPYYRIITVGEKRYVLIHGGLGDAYPRGIAPENWVPYMPLYELLWTRPDFELDYFCDPNTYLIVGHTPTFLLREPGNPATIYHSDTRIIDVDCGAGFPEHGGRLGCLCLETGEEFYVPSYTTGPLKSPD